VRPRSRGWSSIFLALEQLSLAAGTGWPSAAVAAWKRCGVEAGERLLLLLLTQLLLLLLTQLAGSRKGEEGGGGGSGEAELSPEIGEKI
jgi:hypothetical protein